MIPTSDKKQEQVNGDLILSIGEATYVCTLDANKRQSDIKTEEQDIWQIQRIIKYTDESGVSRTEIMYPNGRSSFCYKASEAQNYNYDYRMRL